MPTSKKITAMPSLGGAQVPTDLIPAIDLSALPASQNVQTTLNDLFATITKNITDGALRFQEKTAPATSTASTGAIYFSSTTSTFQVSQAGSAYASIVLAGSITTSGLTQATARILGRTSASSGAVEEITVGANLSLSAGSLAVTGVAVSGPITTSGLTQATARILGRTSASTGAVEEITVGANLSLSAGSLAVTGVAVSGPITTSGLTQATARMLGRTSASTGAVEEITVGANLSLSAGSLAVTGVAVSGPITTSGLTQATARILGRTSASTGAVEEITVGANLSLSAGSLAVTGVAVSGPITTSGLTQATARILGRTSASSGAVEEITVGSGLTLSAGTLSASGSGPGGSTGDYQINSAGTFAAGVIAQGSTGRLTLTPTASSSGTAAYFNLRTPADTGITVSTESVGVWLGGSTGSTVTRNWTGPGTVTTQREMVVTAPTYTSTGGVTVITTGATLAITGAPIETGTVGVTNALALWVQSGNSRVSLDVGTNVRPGFQLGAFNTGFFQTGVLLAISTGGIPAIGWNGATGNTTIGDPYSIIWGSLGLTIPDISLSRSAVSVLRVGDASTGAGQLLVAANGTTATGQVTILSAGTTRNALFAQGAPGGTFAPLVGVVNPSVTSVATTHVMSLRARSTGTPAAGFGGTLNLSAQTSTTNDVEAAEIVWSWTTATHATRTSQIAVSVVAGGTTISVCKIDSAGLTISQRGLYLTQTSGGANYTGFIAPSTLTATSPYTLPTNYPAANGYMLASDTAGTLSWMGSSTDILATQVFS